MFPQTCPWVPGHRAEPTRAAGSSFCDSSPLPRPLLDSAQQHEQLVRQSHRRPKRPKTCVEVIDRLDPLGRP